MYYTGNPKKKKKITMCEKKSENSWDILLKGEYKC